MLVSPRQASTKSTTSIAGIASCSYYTVKWLQMIHGQIRFTLALGIAALSIELSNVAIAQEPNPIPSPTGDTSNTVQVLNQLIEQNQRLEKEIQQLQIQNHQLMEQIKVLHPEVAKDTNGSGQASNASSAQSNGGKETEQTGQSSSQGQSNGDDKTRMPEPSEGNPIIFGEFNPGRGFTVGRGKYGELNLSGYVVARYLNQLPATQSGTDHLGRPIQVSPRQDFQFHRVMLFSQGWLFSPKFLGWNAFPGTQSMQGSHPYWPSYDRVMADEFFRPFFSQGVFAEGNLLPKLQYRWLVGNNLSNLAVPAIRLSRRLSAGAALTWLPTTGEFGPRGAFGDYEQHEELATRFNLAYTYSPEDRQTPIGTPAANTTLRLADSLNIFDTGALANGVTIDRARYQMLSVAAGMKYHGFWLQGEGYGRRLDNLVADGTLPVRVVRNSGFYVQLADMVVPKRLELYGATSYIFGDFGHPREFIGGSNYYPWNTRNIRLNAQLIYVYHSPVQ